MEPGQRAYEAWLTALGLEHKWDDTHQHAWAAVEAALVPPLPADVARLVERLGWHREDERGKLVLANPDGQEAAYTIRAQAAEIERLKEHIAKQQMDIVTLGFMAGHAEATEAKLREAVEVMRTVDAMIYNDNGDVTWSPLQIRSAIRAFLATMEKPHD
jgi:hypothetical protein